MKCTESQERNWTREAPHYRSLLMIISRDISLRSTKYSWTQRQNIKNKYRIGGGATSSPLKTEPSNISIDSKLSA